MNIADFPSHCGSEIFHQFYDTKVKINASVYAGNVRTFFGIFVDHHRQQNTYKKLARAFKILYQSPVLVNPSTNREYFIVIWLNEKP